MSATRTMLPMAVAVIASLKLASAQIPRPDTVFVPVPFDQLANVRWTGDPDRAISTCGTFRAYSGTVRKVGKKKGKNRSNAVHAHKRRFRGLAIVQNLFTFAAKLVRGVVCVLSVRFNNKSATKREKFKIKSTPCNVHVKTCRQYRIATLPAHRTMDEVLSYLFPKIHLIVGVDATSKRKLFI